MPIRFQVDGDFYDHPKTIGMDDSATALWVRAGSYSAAKLTDGFIADAALSLLSRCPAEAASELVERGLWRKVRGGYRFHEWSHRNLTRARVESDRAADRNRKRQTRQAGTNGKEPQVNPQVVHPDVGADADRNPNGVHPLSVSLSVSESVSGSGRRPDTVPDPPPPPPQEPPPRCPDHLDEPAEGACGRCADARRRREAWAKARALAEATARAQLAHDRAEANAVAIAACRLCDERGYLNGAPCPHDPTATTRARRGAAAARAALTGGDPDAA